MVDLRWQDDHHVVVGGTVVEVDVDHASDADQLVALKPRPLIEKYVDLLLGAPSIRVVELGTYQGGSTALIAQLAQPEKLIAIDLEREPPPPLVRFVADQGLDHVVRLYNGVDQADHARLHEILANELSGAPLDLVIDDASHLLGPTLGSFNALFAHLRPGGSYVIEDWRWDHQYASNIMRSLGEPDAPDHATVRAACLDIFRGPATPLSAVLRQELDDARRDPRSVWHETATAMADELERDEFGPVALEPADPWAARRSLASTSLTQLVLALLLATAWSPGAVAEVVVDPWWITVRRGPDPLDPATFRLQDLYADLFGLTQL